MSKLINGTFAGFCSLFLIGLPFVLGYGIRCGRNVLKGDDALPEWGSDNLFNEGVKALALWLPYAVFIYMISFVLSYVLGMINLDLNGISLFGSIFKTVIRFVIIEPIFMMLWISMIILIDTGDIQRAFNPSNGLKLLASRPFEFIKAMILAYAATFIVSLPLIALVLSVVLYKINICLICIGLIAYLGFLAYVSTCIHVFIWAKFYRRVTGGNIGTPAVESPGQG
jgi:hypothetical protein